MNSTVVRAAYVGVSILGFLHITQSISIAGFVVEYTVGATGQTASADFSFLTSNSLEIVLRETTPSTRSSLVGGTAVLTRLGFNLPNGRVTGGTVHIGPGSSSIGFGNVSPQLGTGADVSSHWGFSEGKLPDALTTQAQAFVQQASLKLQEAGTLDAEEAAKRALAKQMRDAAAQILSNNPDPQMKADAADLIKAAEQREAEAAALATLEADARASAATLQAQADDLAARAGSTPDLHFVGVLQPGETPFLAIPPGNNLIGAGAFDGIQGGLLDDLAARGGLGVIGNSVVLTLTLSDPFSAVAQGAFLDELQRSSLVEFGNGAALVSPTGTSTVPEPSTITLLLAFGATFLGTASCRRSARRILTRHSGNAQASRAF